MGVKVYKAKKKREWKGKNLWIDVGFTVFVKEDGKMSLQDDRTDTNYYLFATGEGKKKADEPQARVDTPQDPISDDIPF